MAERQHNPSYVGRWTDDAGQVWRRRASAVIVSPSSAFTRCFEETVPLLFR